MYDPTLAERATEIEAFLGCTGAEERLAKGFHYQHALVAEDFRRANPGDDNALLEWYRTTDAYIWELSAYHAKEHLFNYSGMCSGITARFKPGDEVMALGDGIGDLTIALHDAGIAAYYHDLAGSHTANFAESRFRAHYPDQSIPGLWVTDDWEPELGLGEWDGVVALDFMEHVTDVPAWTEAIYESLRPGGRFMAQNAFGIGDDEHEGSIPMHLTRNNRYQQEWGALLGKVGFEHEIAEWWVKT